MNVMKYFVDTGIVALFIGYFLPIIELVRNTQSNRLKNRAYASYVISCFVSERVVIYVYYHISSKLNNNILVQSGIALTVILIFSGYIICFLHNYLKVKSKKDRDKEPERGWVGNIDKIFILGCTTFICAIDILIIDYKISLFFISLLLGKYFWFDSGLLSIRESYKKIYKDWKSVSRRAKNTSFEFGIVLLVSDYIGILIPSITDKISSYIISLASGIFLCIIYTLYLNKQKRNIMKYKVGALVTGMIYDEFEVESEEQAIEMMFDKHGDESIRLCSNCERKVSGLTVSEDANNYEVEEIGMKV